MRIGNCAHERPALVDRGTSELRHIELFVTALGAHPRRGDRNPELPH